MRNIRTNNSITRRDAIKRTACAAAAVSILPASLRGQSASSKRVNLLMIGTGRQGIHANLRTFLGMDNVRVAAVCDVDSLRMNYAKSLVDEAYGNKDCKTFGDFREALELDGLDAVMVSTPDHWHAIPALAAMKKGLHVCCEKPLTLFVEEGRALAEMARKTGVVFRTDSECRSNAYMMKTADLVLNGYIGNIERLEVGVPFEKGVAGGDPTPMPVPEHLDYEMWQGPAELRPYTVDRVHVTDPETGKFVGRPGWFRCSDYGTGMLANWGGHVLDVANLLNGTSHTGPVSVEGKGAFPEPGSGLWDTIIEAETQFKFANGVTMDFRMDRPYVKAYGDEGWIHAYWGGNSKLEASDQAILRTRLKDTDKPVSRESDKEDFINAVLHGDPVMIDAEAGHRVNSQALIATIAVRLGKKLGWDPVNEKFDDDKANDLLKGHWREPWNLKKFA